MRSVRTYLDEHGPRAVQRGLHQRGVDAVTVSDVGMLGASDAEPLTDALRTQRVLFTQDADFLRLAAAGIPHAGIVYALQGRSIGEIIRGLMLIYQMLEGDEMAERIEYL